MIEGMTQQERLENMFLMDKIVIESTKEELEDIGLDESYIGRTGYVYAFHNNGTVTLDIDGGERIKLYKHMIQEA